MKIFNRITAILVLLIAGYMADAQESIVLDLNSCVELAKAQSPEAEIAALIFSANEREYDAFLAGFRPQMSLNASFPGLRRSYSNVQQDDGTPLFIYQSQTFSDVNFIVSQPLSWTGGSISVFSNLSNYSILDDAGFSSWRANPLGIRLSQPLFQVNRMKWDRQAEKMGIDLSRFEYNQAMENTAINVTSIYFDALVAQVNVERAQKNVVNNDTIYQLSQGRFGVGKIAENELLQSELSVMNARVNLESAQLNYLRAIRQLRTALQLPNNTPIEIRPPGDLPSVSFDPEFAVAKALDHSDLRTSQQLQKLNADRAVKEAQANNRFTADINATFGLNQRGNSIKEAYSNPIDQETFSIGIDIPLVQWGKGKAELDAAVARQRVNRTAANLEQQTFQDQVYFQVLELQQLDAQLKVSARSDTVAQRRYEITKNRYLIGKISIQDLFIAQQEKDAAQIRYLENLRSLWVAWFALRATTLYDFENNVPIE